jgi:chromosomal replication initiation ATPase DnaA
MTTLTKIKISAIKRIVAAGFEVSIEALDSYARTKDLALARQVAMAFAREFITELVPFTTKFAPVPYATIAAGFNRDDHETVRHACKRVERLYALDPYFSARVDRLRREIEAELRKARAA